MRAEDGARSLDYARDDEEKGRDDRETGGLI